MVHSRDAMCSVSLGWWWSWTLVCLRPSRRWSPQHRDFGSCNMRRILCRQCCLHGCKYSDSFLGHLCHRVLLLDACLGLSSAGLSLYHTRNFGFAVLDFSGTMDGTDACAADSFVLWKACRQFFEAVFVYRFLSFHLIAADFAINILFCPYRLWHRHTICHF